MCVCALCVCVCVCVQHYGGRAPGMPMNTAFFIQVKKRRPAVLRVRWQNVAFDTHNTHTQYAPTPTQNAPTYAHAHAQLIAVTLLSNMSRDMLVQLKHDIPLNKHKHMHDFDRLGFSTHTGRPIICISTQSHAKTNHTVKDWTKRLHSIHSVPIVKYSRNKCFNNIQLKPNVLIGMLCQLPEAFVQP